MKTPTSEDLQFLEKLSQEMNTQDKRATAYPLFVIYDKVKVYREDGEERERKEEETGGMCDSCLKLCEEGEDVPDECDDCEEEQFYHYDWEDQVNDEYGVFFTAKACKETIMANGHHFNKPYSFAISAYHSEEMIKVMEIIARLTSDENKLR